MKKSKILSCLLLVLLCCGLAVMFYIRTNEPEPKFPVESEPVVEETPEPTPTPTPEPTPTPTPEPYADRPEIDKTSWEYVLVNKDNLLAADYAPELTSVENGQNFDSRAVEALKEFVAAARNEGLSVVVSSTYRPYATQEMLFNNKVNEYVWSSGSREAAIEKAKTIVAYPGTSEHQLGLATDIVDKYYQYMNESLEDTELSKWMKAHCAEYGFILRYPKDKTEITGVMFEPWHFRYVGKEAAEYIMKNALCLEEFIALYRE